jgi:hypothetical protein
MTSTPRHAVADASWSWGRRGDRVPSIHTNRAADALAQGTSHLFVGKVVFTIRDQLYLSCTFRQDASPESCKAGEMGRLDFFYPPPLWNLKYCSAVCSGKCERRRWMCPCVRVPVCPWACVPDDEAVSWLGRTDVRWAGSGIHLRGLDSIGQRIGLVEHGCLGVGRRKRVGSYLGVEGARFIFRVNYFEVWVHSPRNSPPHHQHVLRKQSNCFSSLGLGPAKQPAKQPPPPATTTCF